MVLRVAWCYACVPNYFPAWLIHFSCALSFLAGGFTTSKERGVLTAELLRDEAQMAGNRDAEGLRAALLPGVAEKKVEVGRGAEAVERGVPCTCALLDFELPYNT